MDKELINLLHEESIYEISDELLDRFLSKTTEVHLNNKEALIPYRKRDSNVYVMKSGIMKFAYFDGNREKIYGFALPGTVMISYHPFYKNLPSFLEGEACGECVVLKISKTELNELMKSSNDFAIWMFYVVVAQSYFNERKISVINGNAAERFLSLIENRPEIMASVPLQTIASYLGITPTYLSRLKKAYMK